MSEDNKVKPNNNEPQYNQGNQGYENHMVNHRIYRQIMITTRPIQILSMMIMKVQEREVS